MLSKLLNRWRRYREDRAYGEGQFRTQLEEFKKAEMIRAGSDNADSSDNIDAGKREAIRKPLPFGVVVIRTSDPHIGEP